MEPPENKPLIAYLKQLSANGPGGRGGPVRAHQKVLESLRSYPLPLTAASDAGLLDGVGGCTLDVISAYFEKNGARGAAAPAAPLETDADSSDASSGDAAEGHPSAAAGAGGGAAATDGLSAALLDKKRQRQKLRVALAMLEFQSQLTEREVGRPEAADAAAAAGSGRAGREGEVGAAVGAVDSAGRVRLTPGTSGWSILLTLSFLNGSSPTGLTRDEIVAGSEKIAGSFDRRCKIANFRGVRKLVDEGLVEPAGQLAPRARMSVLPYLHLPSGPTAKEAAVGAGFIPPKRGGKAAEKRELERRQKYRPTAKGLELGRLLLAQTDAPALSAATGALWRTPPESPVAGDGSADPPSGPDPIEHSLKGQKNGPLPQEAAFSLFKYASTQEAGQEGSAAAGTPASPLVPALAAVDAMAPAGGDAPAGQPRHTTIGEDGCLQIFSVDDSPVESQKRQDAANGSPSKRGNKGGMAEEQPEQPDQPGQAAQPKQAVQAAPALKTEAEKYVQIEARGLKEPVAAKAQTMSPSQAAETGPPSPAGVEPVALPRAAPGSADALPADLEHAAQEETLLCSLAHLSRKAAASVNAADFDTVLLVDYREIASGTGPSAGSSAKTALLECFRSSGIAYETARLAVGDFAWVARFRTKAIGSEFFAQVVRSNFAGEAAAGAESLPSLVTTADFVLPVLVERKTVADLAASIMDGRYDDQKFRLLRSPGIDKVTLIVEGQVAGAGAAGGLGASAIRSAVANSQVVTGFHVVFAESIFETADIIIHLTRRFLQKVTDAVAEGPAAMLRELIAHSPLFSFWNRRSKKLMTISDIYGRQLGSVEGLSEKSIEFLLAHFPTGSELITVFESHLSDAALRQHLKLREAHRYGGEPAEPASRIPLSVNAIGALRRLYAPHTVAANFAAADPSAGEASGAGPSTAG